MKRRNYLKGVSAGVASLAGCSGLLGRNDGTEEEPTDSPTGTAVGTTELPGTTIATWRGGDPTSAVTVQWISGDETVDPEVSLVSADGDGTETVAASVGPFGESDTWRYRAAFDGLATDASYRIHLGGRDTQTSIRTAPEQLDEPMTFAEGGDIGTTEHVQPLHEIAASWDPLFGLVGGDLAYANAEAANVGRWETFLSDWHRYMRSGDRLVPIVAAIGNHEVDGHIHGTPADAPFFYSLFDNPHRENAYWTLDVGEDASIVILDSNHTTEVPGPQTDWFEDQLSSRQDRDHLMAAYHVPAYPSGKPLTDAGRDRVDVREEWVPLLEEYEVDVAFEHDDHTYSRTHLMRDDEPADDGILYVGDGAWGKGPREIIEQDYQAVAMRELHVIRTVLTPDGDQEYTVVNEQGDTIDEFRRSEL